MGVTAALLSAQAIMTVGSAVTNLGAIKTEGELTRSQLSTNQAFAELNAEDAIARGKKDADNYRKAVRKLMGAQRAQTAGQGVDVSTGSARDIQLDTARLGEQDALTIENNAFREAFGYKVEALDLMSQGAMSHVSQGQKKSNTILTSGLQLAQIGLGGMKAYKDSK